MRKDNFTQVLKRFVHQLNIPVTAQSIENELTIHPEYNSLVAISDVLNTWHVPNAAYQLTFDELLDTEIEDPFIAFVLEKEFALVSYLDRSHAVISNEKWNNHKLPISEFEKIYSGSILVAEKEETSGEIEYIANHRKEIYDQLFTPIVLVSGIVILVALLVTHSGYLSNFTWFANLLILVKTTGIVTVSVLISQSFNADNPIFKKLCGSIYSNDCHAIFSSRGSKIYNLVTWGEIGLFYFAGTWLTLIFNSNNVAMLQILGVLNITTIPCTCYLIYYQWKIAKEWCKLCLFVQVLLWVEFICFFPVLTSGLRIPTAIDLTNLAAGIITPVILWALYSPQLILVNKLKPIVNELSDFKYNKVTFETALNSTPKYSLVESENSIVLGNPEAKNVLTVVIKPYGRESTEAYNGANWVQNNDAIKLQIVFATPTNPNDPDTQVAIHLLSLSKLKDSIYTKRAIDEWFSQSRKNYDTWSKRYPLLQKDKIEDPLKINHKWCQLTDVTLVPTIFLNGQQLTLNYKTADLKYFL